MSVVASSDWIIDVGPGAGEEGGKIVFAGTPLEMIGSADGKTSHYLKREIEISTTSTRG
jgi:excinuclease ABC subunit A